MKMSFLLAALVLVAINDSLESQEIGDTRERGQVLAAAARSLESRGATQSDLERFRVPTGAQLDLSEQEWLAAAEEVNVLAQRLEAKSRASIATSRRTGATVKYQTLGERKRGEVPTTASGLTEVLETMYLGMYHIWSERNGFATSDKNAQFSIDELQERIVLEER